MLDLAPQSHARSLGLLTAPKTVVSGAAHSSDLAESIHAGLRFARFLDLLVDAAPPLATLGRACSLKRRKTFFKKSISIVCCPILRSSSGIRCASTFGWDCAACPGNASCSPRARHSPRQVSSLF